jgi:hypothetical protein
MSSDQLEQHAGFRLIPVHVAEVVEDDQVYLSGFSSAFSSDSACRAVCKRLHRVCRAGEQHAIAVLDEGMTERRPKMRLTRAARPEQPDVRPVLVHFEAA